MDDRSKGFNFAVLITLLIMLYIAAITFVPVTKDGLEFAKTILPYLLGVLGILVGYYWGTSSKRKSENAQKNDEISPENGACK